MSDTPQEKRRFSRITFNADVRLTGALESQAGKLIDISLKGALVALPPGWNPPADEPLILELDLDEHRTTIRMQVRVAHRRNGAVGFLCEHIDLESIACLRRLVELNLGDPTILQRELAALG